jgi:osmoprotectant transport system permease protein
MASLITLVQNTYAYASQHLDQVGLETEQHLVLVAIPLAIALSIGLPLGFFSARSRWASLFLINGFNALRVIPSLAVLFLAIPYLGLSAQSAILALTLLTLPPILISTDVAFRSIEASIIEAAVGMGMTPRQVLMRIEIPLAFPVILAGIKTATVEAIASATLAAFIGVGGLGRFIVLGFSLYDNAILLVGAIPVAFLALAAEIGLTLWQRALQPPR